MSSHADIASRRQQLPDQQENRSALAVAVMVGLVVLITTVVLLTW
jgi:hypothetical protein